MPDRLRQWDDVRGEGNPTYHKSLNDLISRVAKKEVRKQGAESKARRPATEGEYRQFIRVLRGCVHPEVNGQIAQYGVPAVLNFQSHMIARIDCATQWKQCHVDVHDQYPEFAGKARLEWSKNVHEERDAPWQILLGSMDLEFCVLVSVGVWLELFLSWPSTTLSPYVFTSTMTTAYPRVGRSPRSRFKTCFEASICLLNTSRLKRLASLELTRSESSHPRGRDGPVRRRMIETIEVIGRTRSSRVSICIHDLLLQHLFGDSCLLLGDIETPLGPLILVLVVVKVGQGATRIVAHHIPPLAISSSSINIASGHP